MTRQQITNWIIEKATREDLKIILENIIVAISVEDFDEVLTRVLPDEEKEDIAAGWGFN